MHQQAKVDNRQHDYKNERNGNSEQPTWACHLTKGVHQHDWLLATAFRVSNGTLQHHPAVEEYAESIVEGQIN